MKTILPLLLAAFSTTAIARGGQGSSADAGLILGIALVIGIAAICAAVRKHYPGIPQAIGGVIIFLMLGQFLAAILSAIGIIPASAVALTGISIAAAAPFAIAFVLNARNR